MVEEAAGWLVTLKDTPNGSPVSGEFEVWLAASADHRRAWERVNATWGLLGASRKRDAAENDVAMRPSRGPSRRATADRAVGLAMGLAMGRATDRAMPGRAAGRRRSRTVAALGAGLAIAALLAFVAPDALVRMRADHLTAAGETERVRLVDGTLVDLGGNSAIKINVEGRERLVTLLAGEAFFDVAPDPARAFVVNAEGLELRVLGTAFDVRVTSTDTTVALLRGSVEVLPASGEPARRLSPGEQLEIDRGSGVMTVGAVSAENIGAWRQGRVFLTDVSLGSVVEMIQRYHTAWISVPDRSLAAIRVSGLFDLNDPDAALAALVKPFGAKVRSVTPYMRVITRL
ncbi:FecR family protein [Pseudochelatococcus sp. B33]